MKREDRVLKALERDIEPLPGGRQRLALELRRREERRLRRGRAFTLVFAGASVVAAIFYLAQGTEQGPVVPTAPQTAHLRAAFQTTSQSFEDERIPDDSVVVFRWVKPVSASRAMTPRTAEGVSPRDLADRALDEAPHR